jgi:hypothetical protein
MALVVSPSPNSIGPVNLSQVGGTNTVNGGLAGSLAAGGTGANAASITQNPMLVGIEASAQGSAPGSVATTGQLIRARGDLYGDQYQLIGSPNHAPVAFSALGTTLTQEIAAPAAGSSIWITGLVTSSVTGASTLTLKYGTGAACATGTTTVDLLTSPLNTGTFNYQPFGTAGIQIPAANAVCLVCGSATNTCSGMLWYYVSN